MKTEVFMVIWQLFFLVFAFTQKAQAVDCTSDIFLRDSVFEYLSNYVSWFPFQPERRESIQRMICETSTQVSVPRGNLVRVEFLPRTPNTVAIATCYLNVFWDGTPDPQTCFNIDFFERDARGLLGVRRIGHYDGRQLYREE